MDDTGEKNGTHENTHGGARATAGRKQGSITKNKKDSVALQSHVERLEIAEEYANATPLFILLQITRHYYSTGNFMAAASCAEKAAKYFYAQKNGVSADEIDAMSDTQLKLIAGGRKAA